MSETNDRLRMVLPLTESNEIYEEKILRKLGFNPKTHFIGRLLVDTNKSYTTLKSPVGITVKNTVGVYQGDERLLRPILVKQNKGGSPVVDMIISPKCTVNEEETCIELAPLGTSPYLTKTEVGYYEQELESSTNGSVKTSYTIRNPEDERKQETTVLKYVLFDLFDLFSQNKENVPSLSNAGVIVQKEEIVKTVHDVARKHTQFKISPTDLNTVIDFLTRNRKSHIVLDVDYSEMPVEDVFGSLDLTVVVDERPKDDILELVQESKNAYFKRIDVNSDDEDGSDVEDEIEVEEEDEEGERAATSLISGDNEFDGE
jgi:hypothetical protein